MVVDLLSKLFSFALESYRGCRRGQASLLISSPRWLWRHIHGFSSSDGSDGGFEEYVIGIVEPAVFVSACVACIPEKLQRCVVASSLPHQPSSIASDYPSGVNVTATGGLVFSAPWSVVQIRTRLLDYKRCHRAFCLSTFPTIHPFSVFSWMSRYSVTLIWKILGTKSFWSFVVHLSCNISKVLNIAVVSQAIFFAYPDLR